MLRNTFGGHITYLQSILIRWFKLFATVTVFLSHKEIEHSMLLHWILMVTTTSDLSNNADKELLSKDHAVDAIRTWKINNQIWNIQASKLFNRICCSIINMASKYYFHIQGHEQYEKLIYD